MSRVVKVLSLLLGVISFPLVLMMAGFAPMLMGGGTQSMTVLQKLLGSGLMIVMLALPLWVLFFGYRTIRSWRSDATFPALMTALPACIAIALFAYANFTHAAR